MYAGPDYTNSIASVEWDEYEHGCDETHEQHAARLRVALADEKGKSREWRARAEERRAIVFFASWTCVALALSLLAILLEGRS